MRERAGVVFRNDMAWVREVCMAIVSEVRSVALGFPRMGADRGLKRALESYWKGQIDAQELQKTASILRERHWRAQQERGILSGTGFDRTVILRRSAAGSGSQASSDGPAISTARQGSAACVVKSSKVRTSNLNRTTALDLTVALNLNSPAPRVLATASLAILK